MKEERKRLARLVAIQNKVRAFHEMQHATALRQAVAARQEADDLMARKQDPQSLSALFPEIYERRIADALARGEESAARAGIAAQKVAAETARAGMVERAYRAVMREEERDRAEREVLEALARLREPDK